MPKQYQTILPQDGDTVSDTLKKILYVLCVQNEAALTAAMAPGKTVLQMTLEGSKRNLPASLERAKTRAPNAPDPVIVP